MTLIISIESNRDNYFAGVRKRFRNVLVPPSDLGMECPNLSEVQPCIGTQCYIWNSGSWGSCQLDPGLTKCGSGRRTRQIFCITHRKVRFILQLCQFL